LGRLPGLVSFHVITWRREVLDAESCSEGLDGSRVRKLAWRIVDGKKIRQDHTRGTTAP